MIDRVEMKLESLIGRRPIALHDEVRAGRRGGHGDAKPDFRVVAGQPFVDELAKVAEGQRIAVASDVQLGPGRVRQRCADSTPVARMVRTQRGEAREHARAPGCGQRVVIDADVMSKVLMRGRGHHAYPSFEFL